jgi:hypothetical protein
LVWARADDSATPGSPSRPRADVQTLRPPGVHPTAAARSGSTAAAPSGPGAGSWRQALDALDATRALAFASRDASLLQRVYASNTLLRADTAMLRRAVPSGCVLSGVRTRYSGVAVTVDGERAVITATATLPVSQLRCRGRPSATVPGAGPTRLRLELVPTGAGPRIARQAVVAG